jgi:hypothetical protein
VVSNDTPTPWHDAVVCGACDRQLLPLTYTTAENTGPIGGDDRPYLKCPGCGIRYRWQDSAGWVPAVAPA